MLYGVNEEMGGNEVKAPTPIQVNNNCLQCSGNASFIKKAFKLACLTYASTKVTWSNDQYMREELLQMREEMLFETEVVDVDKMLEAYESQENERKRMGSTSTLKGMYTGGGRLTPNLVTAS